ncbi:MAG TPA: GH92 family glycosyl hydrolase [Terracidiphilus sp.]|nr:GH92 family glycosyl hydrolase [Terracidiphilus sp.]
MRTNRMVVSAMIESEEEVVSRREFLGGVSAAALGGAHILKAAGASLSGSENTNVSDYVRIEIGTGGHGHTYPGATVPFGMVQLSPDTFNRGWDWCSGYHDTDTSIMGFSHTHLSGTGIGDMLDFLLMPCTGAVKTVPGTRENPGEGYRSRFSHANEKAVPGYYSVLLDDYKIHAELSATTRAGIHRYTFPQDASSHFILDLFHGYDDGPDSVRWANVKVVGNDTIVGGRGINRWANGREIYFAMKFSRPFDSVTLLSDDKPLDSGTHAAQGKSLKCVLHFATRDNETILVKTGISGVSIEGAQLNLGEIPAWDFDRVVSDARRQWEAELSKIRVEGGTERQKQIFYTSLYHSMLAPTLFDDADGQYRGMDGQVHRLPADEHNYSTFSLWDTYRAAHPLYTLFQPERVPAMANCLIRMAQQSPVGMPVWPLQAKETECMTGYHSVGVIAEALRKGFPGIDAKAAYACVRKQAFESSYRGLPEYRKFSYIPCDLVEESVGKSMDYAYNDWAAAHIAWLAGNHDDATALFKRSHNYRNLYDSTSTFIRPRLADGKWSEPFAPNEIGHSKKWRDYTESNPWQATFAVQHDPQGLAQLLGGRKQLEAKLDGIFTADSTLPPDAPDDIAGLVGQYAHGNEPSHHIAYLYVYAGAPHKTQDYVAKLMDTMYDTKPDGLAGNEDCGQMSAWYVMSAMGFYAVDPVSANYVFGTPLFDKVTIELGSGRKLVIDAHRESSSSRYIDAASLNGKAQSRLWFAHADIAHGGTISLRLADKPNLTLGAGKADAPPSMTA